MLIGYARVSTHDQTLALQQDALEKEGCEQIFTDTVSGTKTERKGLTAALSHLRGGDILVVWRLDRLGRFLTADFGMVDPHRRRTSHDVNIRSR